MNNNEFAEFAIDCILFQTEFNLLFRIQSSSASGLPNTQNSLQGLRINPKPVTQQVRSQSKYLFDSQPKNLAQTNNIIFKFDHFP